jgi:hypothetical protein
MEGRIKGSSTLRAQIGPVRGMANLVALGAGSEFHPRKYPIETRKSLKTGQKSTKIP